MRNYENELLEKAVNLAKEMGLTVWTFEATGTIKQVFFDNGKVYGTVSDKFGFLSYATCHKANSISGTGLQIEETCEVSKDCINKTLLFCPNFTGSKYSNSIVKQTFEKHIKNSILKYYKL